MRKALSLLAAAALCVVAQAHKGQVVELGDGNFTSVTSEGLWVIKFTAPWCGHCKQLAPKFQAAAAAVPEVSWANVDATLATGLKSQFSISSFPRIMWGRGGQLKDFSGTRDEAALVRFAHRVNGPAVVLGAGVKQVEGDASVGFMFVGEPSGKLWDAFSAAAEAGHGTFDYGQTSAVEGVAILPAVVRVEGGEGVQVYPGEASASAVTAWMQSVRFATVTDLGPGIFYDIAHRGGRMLVMGLVDPGVPDQQHLVTTLHTLARPNSPVTGPHPGVFNFGTLDGTKWADYIAKFNISPGDLPRVLVLDAPNGVYYDDATVDEVDEVATWLQEVARGEVPKNREGMLYYPTMLWNTYGAPHWPWSGLAVAGGGLVLVMALGWLLMTLCSGEDAPAKPAQAGKKYGKGKKGKKAKAE